MNVVERRVRRTAPWLVSLALLGLLAPLHGCSKRKAGETSMPRDPGAEDAAPSSSDPLAELDALEGRMAELGLPVAPRRASGSETKSKGGEFAPAPAGGDAEGEVTEDEVTGDGVTGDGVVGAPEAEAEPSVAAQVDMSLGEGSSAEAASRCEDLCSLNEAICELEIRICEMSENHSADPSYADACERAIDDCATSGDACDACHV